MPEPGAIRDYADLVTALVGRQASLSRRNNEIARFFLNHPEEVALSGIVALAGHAGVPPAAITRFAKELGFTGFPDLQRIFRERLLGPRPSYAERLAALDPGTVEDADLDRPDRVFDMLLGAAVQSLVRIGEAVDRAALKGAVAALSAAEAVHVVAARGAYSIGAYAFYGLSNMGKRSFLIDNLGAMRAEQLAAMGERDALLAFTFDDYTPETVEIARRAARDGRTVIAVTDNELSPVAPVARHVLYVKEARLGHFRSQVPALVLTQALILSLGRRRVAGDFQNAGNEKDVADPTARREDAGGEDRGG